MAPLFGSSNFISHARPSNESTAAPMSGLDIKLSPTKIASTPAASSRATSARVRMPLSETSTHSSGTRSAQPQRVLQVGTEGAQIAIVHADQRRAGVEHPLQIRRVVQFHERRHLPFDGQPVQQAEVAIVEAFGDQQHRVGAGCPRFEQLILIENEILPQQRQRHGRADGAEIGEAALKIGCVGQHAETSGAVPLVGHGDIDRVEIRANDAGRRTRLLHLGDQADRPRLCEGGEKIAGRGRGFRFTSQRRFRLRRFG